MKWKVVLMAAAAKAVGRGRQRQRVDRVLSQRSPLRRKWGVTTAPSSANCTWKYYEQPLDHFAVGSAGTLTQRVCVYDGFSVSTTGDSEDGSPPVLFYCGNESPVEEYVNNTGLMWEVGAEIGATLVFAEHRYEGESVPETAGTEACMAYCTVEQALADYAGLLLTLQDEWGAEQGHNNNRKVVAVGGSYGGMLAGWLRAKYPSSVVGAVAASAPIWGFPTLDGSTDGSSVAVARAFSEAGGLGNDTCRENLLGAWPLIAYVGETPEGRRLLKEEMGLCSDSATGSEIIAAVQNIFFDLAEANYPFESTYITSAVGPGYYPLPAWPVKKACTALLSDFFVRLSGDVSAVEFDVQTTDGVLSAHVSWANVSASFDVASAANSTSLSSLLAGVAHLWATWCNVSGTLDCLDVAGDCATGLNTRLKSDQRALHSFQTAAADTTKKEISTSGTQCSSSYTGGSWDPLTCNDDLYLANYLSQGTGPDALFWPPNQPKNATLAQILGAKYGDVLPGCVPPAGLAGYPNTSDPWARHMIAQFGDQHAALDATNIVFSNGLLDPWSPAGVYPDPAVFNRPGPYDGPFLLNLSASVHALILDLGAHHLDLFFLDDQDPECAFQARLFQTSTIKSWLLAASSSSSSSSSS